MAKINAISLSKLQPFYKFWNWCTGVCLTRHKLPGKINNEIHSNLSLWLAFGLCRIYQTRVYFSQSGDVNFWIWFNKGSSGCGSPNVHNRKPFWISMTLFEKIYCNGRVHFLHDPLYIMCRGIGSLWATLFIHIIIIHTHTFTGLELYLTISSAYTPSFFFSSSLLKIPTFKSIRNDHFATY